MSLCIIVQIVFTVGLMSDSKGTPGADASVAGAVGSSDGNQGEQPENNTNGEENTGGAVTPPASDKDKSLSPKSDTDPSYQEEDKGGVSTGTI